MQQWTLGDARHTGLRINNLELSFGSKRYIYWTVPGEDSAHTFQSIRAGGACAGQVEHAGLHRGLVPEVR
jgi:hypothetical protein